MMATSYQWITSVLIAIIALSRHSCETVSVQNREAPPQKMVEIIELMLSPRPNDSEKKGFGIQKVSQDEAPNYEIHITPNKNLEELKGSQKIKIFVEAANFRDEKTPQDPKTRNVETEKREKPTVFDVLPLSIETVGLNIEHYQQPGIPVVKLKAEAEEELPQKDFESYPSKRQTNWAQSQKPRVVPKAETSRQVDIKEVPIYREPSYVDQNNPYQPINPPKKDDRSRNPTYDADYTSSQNVKWVSQPGYVDEYVSPVEEPIRTPSRPVSKRPYEENPYEEVRPSNERRPNVREPEEARRPKPTYPRDEDEYITAGSRNPGYGNERRPTYVEESRPTYSREPVEYENSRPSNNRNPVYSREPEDTRPSNNRDEYLEEDTQPIRRPSYEQESSYNSRPQDGGRPVRENNKYSGFPESHEAFINNHYLKPLQSESPRVFPASPCLNVFKYEGREPEEDRWYGDIYVSTDEALNGIRLDVILDKPAEILTNWLAETKTTDSKHFTILSLNHKLMPGPPETVRIMVKFNGKKPVPFVKSISLNGRVICPSNRAQKTTTRRPVYENPGDLQTRRTTPRYQEVPKRPINSGDGTVKRTTPIYEENRKTTPRPLSEYPRPNPNGYEETDQNSFGAPTKKPHSPGRPAHSNGNPPAHAAKPSHPNKPGNSQNHGHGQGPKKTPPPPPPPTSSLSSQPNFEKPQKEITCGIPSVQPRPLITHGQLTSRGQWPWHVALYKNVGTDLNFFCGGSLLNKNYVVTAAHCVTKTYTTKPLDENTLVVYLGKYHLKLWSEGGVQNRQVSKIHVHPKYNSTNFQSDIAVLALSSPVEYTDYIRPICLWDRSNIKIEVVEGKEGTVVGWGFDETKKLTEELRQAKMPVVKQQECLWSYTDFYPQFTSNLTYCAGFRNGTSVCNGDSGGGMVFPYKDRNGVERWHLRGIVSISPARNDSRVCDPTHFVVFTDVAKFLTWLDNFL